MKSLFDDNFKRSVLMLCDQVERTTIACGLSPTTVLTWRWSATTSCVPKALIMSLWRYFQNMSSIFFLVEEDVIRVGVNSLSPTPVHFLMNAVLNLQMTLWGDLSSCIQQAASGTLICFWFSYFDASVVILSLFVTFCSSFVCLCGIFVSLNSSCFSSHKYICGFMSFCSTFVSYVVLLCLFLVLLILFMAFFCIFSWLFLVFVWGFNATLVSLFCASASACLCSVCLTFTTKC